MQFTKALQHTIVWKVLNTLLTFCINILLVRIMGAGHSGDFFYAVAALSFFTLVMSWSIESGITYYGSNDPITIVSLAVFVMPWLILQGLGSWILLGLIHPGTDRQLSWLFICSNLAIVYFSALYYAQKRFVSLNIIVCSVNLLVLVMLYAIYTKYGNNTYDATNRSPSIQKGGTIFGANYYKNFEGNYFAPLIYFSGFALQALVLMIFFFSKADVRLFTLKFPPGLIKKLFAYSSIAFISNILFFLVTRIDYYFVQKYCNEIELSNYVQVSKMGQLLVLLPSMMAAVIFPFSSGKDDGNYLEKLQALCRIITLLFIPVMVVVILAGYWLFPWLFGYGFTLMYPAFLWYLPGFYSLSLVTLLAAHLAGRAMLISNMIASVIALAVVITGDILLIPLWGINAAAAISSGAYFLCLAYLLWIYKIKLGAATLDFFAFKSGDLKVLSGNYKFSR